MVHMAVPPAHPMHLERHPPLMVPGEIVSQLLDSEGLWILAQGELQREEAAAGKSRESAA